MGRFVIKVFIVLALAFLWTGFVFAIGIAKPGESSAIVGVGCVGSVLLGPWAVNRWFLWTKDKAGKKKRKEWEIKHQTKNGPTKRGNG